MGELKTLKRSKCYENNWFNYLLIILAGMNIFNRGSIILLLFAVYNFLIFPKRKIYFDFTALILYLFVVFGAISCFVFMGMTTAFTEIFKLLNYLCLYLVGKTGYKIAYDKEKYIYRILFSAFMGVLLNLIITYFYNMQLGGIDGRVLYSFWTKENVSVTLIGLLSCIIIGWSYYGLFLSGKLSLKIITIVSLALTFFINMETATRTPIVLFFVMMVFLTVILLLNSKYKNRFTIAGGLILLVSFFFIAYAANWFDLKNIIENSPLFERFEDIGMETGRNDIMLKYFEFMPQYLWGGGYISAITKESGHTIWLQCYDRYGCLTTLCLLIVLFHILYNIFRLIRQTKKSKMNFLLLGVCVSIFIQCMLEPIITGFPIVFWFLLLFDGIITSRFEKGKSKI